MPCRPREPLLGGCEPPRFADWLSNGMGLLEANRELIAWIRRHNAETGATVRFYGFDMPLGAMAFASPRLVLERLYDLVPERRDRLEVILGRERGRGRVFVFAHNGHLKRGRMHWRMGDVTHAWWPAGAHVSRALGRQYAVIGSGVGTSDENGIAAPEAGSLEARFHDTALVPTTAAPAALVAGLVPRTGSRRNPTYFPWTGDCLTDYDWLAFVKTTTYQRGGPPLAAWDTGEPADAAAR